MKPERVEVKLGDKARDRITGFIGIVTAITDWLSGCRRITIESRELKDGKPVGSLTLDVEQVAVIASEPAPTAARTGGPQPEPTRAADPV